MLCINEELFGSQMPYNPNDNKFFNSLRSFKFMHLKNLCVIHGDQNVFLIHFMFGLVDGNVHEYVIRVFISIQIRK